MSGLNLPTEFEGLRTIDEGREIARRFPAMEPCPSRCVDPGTGGRARCTRSKGHDGPHVSHATPYLAVSWWPLEAGSCACDGSVSSSHRNPSGFLRCSRCGGDIGRSAAFSARRPSGVRIVDEEGDVDWDKIASHFANRGDR